LSFVSLKYFNEIPPVGQSMSRISVHRNVQKV
jgi:hypothetical protein